MATFSHIRTAFFDHFTRRDHTHVPSGPLIPQSDPTLMFTSAGMVPFKNVFTGSATVPYARAVTSQKCLRAGGKHNDLENVGYTPRHHTFFEMLGNFSFGDYFKEQAIVNAWDLVVKTWGLPVDRLWVTVYAEDEDARVLWRKVSGLADERIVSIATSDNFWQMGDTGPCGPCSEIFYDYGPDVSGGPPGSPEEDGDRFVEIWNLVFMQFDRQTDGTMTPLPKPSIDTGMGLERITAVLNGKTDNYDTDLFREIMAESCRLTGSTLGRNRSSHKVMADHLRAAVFLIAEGMLPSNEGRGYVLRRIMRRAMRHGRRVQGKDPQARILSALVDKLVELQGADFPEIKSAQTMVTKVIEAEEDRFTVLMDRGLRLLETQLDKLGETRSLPGDVAFRLYDTYGFPLDLTQEVLQEQGRTVDEDGFHRAMEEQRRRARAAWKGTGDTQAESLGAALGRLSGEETRFVGYDALHVSTTIRALVVNRREVDDLSDAETDAVVVLEQTPFYAESGGQVGDRGTIRVGDSVFGVRNTRKTPQGLWLHEGRMERGRLRVGDNATATVDETRRIDACTSHTATHLLHEALRRRLGEHVQQKGSYVGPDGLRFDFSHPAAMTRRELREVEADVNAAVRANHRVTAREAPLEVARNMGARALFGEKYGDVVRMVSVGGTLGSSGGIDQNFIAPYSLELCGGTHVDATGDIGAVVLMREGSVAAGIRRVEALTGKRATDWIRTTTDVLNESAGLLHAAPDRLAERVTRLMAENADLTRKQESLQQKVMIHEQLEKGNYQQTQVGTTNLGVLRTANVGAKDLRTLTEHLTRRQSQGVVVVTGEDAGKATVLVALCPGAPDGLNAGDMIRAAALAIKGQGGGRKNMAQAGGTDPSGLPQAIQAVKEAIGSASSP